MQEAVQEALANLRLEVTHKGDEESVLDDLATIECAITQLRATPERLALSGHLLSVRETLRNGGCIESVSIDFDALSNLVISAPVDGAQIVQDDTFKSNPAPVPSPSKLQKSDGAPKRSEISDNDGAADQNEVDDFDAFLSEVKTLSISDNKEDTAAETPGRCADTLVHSHRHA